MCVCVGGVILYQLAIVIIMMFNKTLQNTLVYLLLLFLMIMNVSWAVLPTYAGLS